MKITKLFLVILLSSGLQQISSAQSNMSSISFDGADDYITLGDPSDGSLDFSSSESFTMVAWIKTSFVPATYTDILFKRVTVSGVHNEGFILAVNSSGTIYFVVEGTNSSFSQMDGNIVVTDGNWHQIAATRDVANDNINIYVDGVLDVSMADNTTATLEGSSNFYIGHWDYYGRYFNGKIDDVSVWNTVLTSTQINNYMNCPPVGNESNLISYWKFEEATGTTASDASTNFSNDGLLTNGPTWDTDHPNYLCQLSVEEQNENSLIFNIFPNPVTTVLNFDLFSNNLNHFIIKDIIGNEVLTGTTNLNTIDVSNIASGVYILEIESNGLKGQKKFIRH